VSLSDCLLRRGHCFDILNPTSLPMTPGFDVVGKIVQVGENVTTFKEGDRVAALVQSGGNARYANVLESSLVRVPLTVDAAEAACMVSTYTAAYQSMKLINTDGAVFSLKGKKVLIIGGMDGVGQALIQMCNKARAEIYATAPPRRHGYIRTMLGATPLPEDSASWLPRVEGQMDIVFDGQCEDGLSAASKAVAKDGQLVCFGFSSQLVTSGMGVFGAPLSAHFNRMRAGMATEKNVDVWDCFQKDPEQFKVSLTPGHFFYLSIPSLNSLFFFNFSETLVFALSASQMEQTSPTHC
jgi:NADPH2:quinone reductase